MIRRILQWTIGAVLAAAGMYIFFRNVDMHSLWTQLTHANPLALAACAGLSIFAIWLRAFRATIILPSCSPDQKKAMFPIVMIAFMINNILPARMGEVARGVLLWKRSKYSGAVSVGSIVLERVLDTMVFLSCFFVPFIFVQNLRSNQMLLIVAILTGAGFLCAFLGFAAYVRFPQQFRRLGRSVSGRLPKKIETRLIAISHDIAKTLDWSFSIRKVLLVFVLSYAISLCYAGAVVIMVNEKWFFLLHGLFAQAFAALGAAIPLAPGYVGTFHAVFSEGLRITGVAVEKIGPVTIIIHAVSYFAVTLLGLYYFLTLHISFKDIAKDAASMNKNNEAAEPKESLT